DPAVDPQDPNIIYSQWQYGGLVRFDRRTGQRVDIRPRETPDGPPLRWNWDSALIISPHSPSRLYYGAQMLFRSDDRGDSWRLVSPDLTRNLDRNKLKVMGRVWSVDAVAKNNSTSFYGTIVALSESPLLEGLLYAGTDDGLIQISEDGGKNWRRVDTFPFLDVPESAYISDIEASRHDADTVYVAVNNHKNADFRPYIVRSTDRGRNWTLISGSLPKRGSVYTIAEDHKAPGLLFAGTEFGVWCTRDGGLDWLPLKSGLPTIAVRDLEIQRREDDLVVGTFGRGFYILDDYSPLRELTGTPTDKACIFPIKKTWMYIPAAPLAGGEKAYQGAAFFTAPNPPFGATITYYLPESLKTRKSQRQEKERELVKQDKDVFYPSWDELKREDREEDPAVVLTIRDRTGEVVRRLQGPTAKGIHRIAWDLRYPSFLPTRLDGDPDGPMALPGKYTAELVTFADGQYSELVPATPLEVEPLGFDDVPEPNRRAILAFQQQTGDLQRAVFGAYRAAEEARQQLRYIKATIERTPQLPLELREEARQLELRLMDLMEKFDGDPTRPKRSEPGMPGIIDRLQTIVAGHWSTTTGPTETHRKSYEIVADEFGQLLPALRELVEKDLVRLSRKLEA
ncbi:MAG: glycosyl hydrolase, partial [Planctomycetes bacterium]|nr:glycosyl hydrolase [Planctomycetota bacterium]